MRGAAAEETRMHRSPTFAAHALILLVALAPVAAEEPSLSPAERAARVEEVRRTELAFAATVRENRPDDFAVLLDDEAVFVGGASVTRGRDAVVAAWAGFFGESRPEFSWHPEVVELSADGTLGLSRGPWTLRIAAADGSTVERTGIFNSVWRRQPDGSWRIVFDAGCDCPPAGG
jgi:ketosteroid isomerase-like protein